MHVQPISTFRLFQEGHLLRNSIAIFVLRYIARATSTTGKPTHTQTMVYGVPSLNRG